MGLAPRIDQANPSHIPVGHLVAAEVYRMVGDQFRIHTPVGLTESVGFKTSIVGRQLLLHDISLDGDLSDKGIAEACKAGDMLKEAGFSFEAAYTSYLKRAVKTLNCVLDRLNEDWIPVEKSWRLNEKHYGILQGLNKRETADKYGEEQVHIWRRSYGVSPEPVKEDDPRYPGNDTRYAGVPEMELPRTESLKDAVMRVMPYWECVILPTLMHRDNLLVVAHGNSP